MMRGMYTLDDLLTISPSAAAFEAACAWLDAHPEHESAPLLQERIADWAPEHRVLHDAQGWNLAIEPRPWSALIDGLIFFDWGPWPEAFERLAAATHLTGLRRLEAHQGELTDAGAAALGASRLLPQIEHLVLTRVGLSPAGAAALARGLGAVRALDVSVNPIADAGLASLISATASTLEVLDASQTDTKSLIGLSEIALPRLRTLNLAMNPLSAAAAESLGSAAWMPGLQHLDLTLCLHTDAHIAGLVEGGIGQHDVALQLAHMPFGGPATVGACLRSPHADLRSLGVETLPQLTKGELRALADLMDVDGSSRLSKAAWIALITTAASQSPEGLP